MQSAHQVGCVIYGLLTAMELAVLIRFPANKMGLFKLGRVVWAHPVFASSTVMGIPQRYTLLSLRQGDPHPSSLQLPSFPTILGNICFSR